MTNIPSKYSIYTSKPIFHLPVFDLFGEGGGGAGQNIPTKLFFFCFFTLANIQHNSDKKISAPSKTRFYLLQYHYVYIYVFIYLDCYIHIQYHKYPHSIPIHSQQKRNSQALNNPQNSNRQTSDFAHFMAEKLMVCRKMCFTMPSGPTLWELSTFQHVEHHHFDRAWSISCHVSHPNVID